jgi:ankyrin repeat protein/S1-C subfamily serine protease
MSAFRRFNVLAALLLILCGSGILHAAEDTPEAAIRRGNAALKENRLDDAITAFQQCLQVATPRYHGCAYGLASGYSRKDDTAKAVEWLARAADWGYEDVAQILEDPDLANVRSHVEYGRILEDIQNRLPPSRPRPYVAPDQPERGMDLVAMLRSELGSGAGIILSHEGNRIYLATANHVVRQGTAEAKTIDVQLKALAPRWHRARLLPSIGDPELDLAILAVDGIVGPNLDFCRLPMQLGGDSSQLRRGDAVYPVGYPGGILWAMPLSPDHASQVFPSQISFESQFVRVGFSGGALLNKQGEIVGMITADEPPLGRAVPSALILEAVRTAGYPVQLSGPAERAKLPLHVAAKAGDLAAIRRLLENCADPNVADAAGRTALHEAAVQGSGDAIRLLVSAGARPHAWALIRSEDSEREWGTPLHFAAEHGRVEAVKALLAPGDVDLETLWRGYDEHEIEQANTALHLAAQHNRADVAEVLIVAGATLEAHTRKGLTPLGIAAANGSVGVARILLRRGAAVQPPDGSSELSPLQVAAEAGKVDVLRLLIQHGVDVNATDSSKYSATALHAAAMHGQVETAAFLISQKAAVNAPGYEGNTPLHAAAKEGFSAVVALLLASGADANSRNQRNETPISLAVERDDLTILQVLVNAKADIGTLLHRVVAIGNINAARILIQGGADVSLMDSSGKQPLHVAAEIGRTEAVDLLLKAGAPVTAVDAYDRTPLHFAAEDNHLAIVELLIAAKAPVNEQDESGHTALFKAVVKQNAAVVGRLLRAGADPNIIKRQSISHDDENSPVAQAASVGPPDILTMLLAARGDPNRRGNAIESPLTLAARGGDAEKKVRMLLKAGANVVAEDETRSALHAALAGDGALAVLTLLLAAGAPVDARDGTGATPLRTAVSYRNIEAVKVLLAGGANVNAADKCGITPLWAAMPGFRDTEQDVLALAEILVAAGADVNVKSSCGSGETILEQVEKPGYRKVRQFLLSKGAKAGGSAAFGEASGTRGAVVGPGLPRQTSTELVMRAPLDCGDLVPDHPFREPRRWLREPPRVSAWRSSLAHVRPLSRRDDRCPDAPRRTPEAEGDQTNGERLRKN